MKNNALRKGILIVMLLAIPLLLSGCVVGSDVQNTSSSDLTFPDINTVINPPTTVPTQSAVADPQIAIVTNEPVNNGWGSPTPTIRSITTVPPSSATNAVVTPPPTSRPTATPQGSLKLGSTGQEVKDLQQRLKALGFYTGSVDGDFGVGTENAVKAFQKQYGLTVDGKVGTQTMAKLTAARATAKPTVSPTPRPTATPAYSSNTYLRNGNSGNQVRQLQEQLIALGYLAGKSTSNFDNATEAAVLAFQRRNGVDADGVAGPNTLQKLYSSSARKASGLAGIIGITLKEGSTETAAIRLLQTRLKSLDYYTGTVDGAFGAGTTAAVEAFQRANRLTVDGQAGGGTLNKLFAADVVSGSASVATPVPRHTNTPRPHVTATPSNVYTLVTAAPNGQYFTLRRGMQGTPVREMQQALKNKGYFSGTVDGYFGEGTELAVMAFQRSNGLKVDGEAGPATLRVLYEGAFPRGS